MAPNAVSQILARSHVASSGFLAAQDVTIKHSLAIVVHVGLVGFEPTACRRGDRSTILGRAPPYLDRFCNIARVALLPSESQSSRCGLGSTALHVWLLLTRQRYGAECGQPNPRKIPRSVVRFSGCAGRNNKTFFGHRRSCRAGGI